MTRISRGALAGLVVSLAVVGGFVNAAGATAAQRTARPPAARGSVRLLIADAFFVRHAPVTVPGRSVAVLGQVRPYVAGQKVRVRVFLGHRRLETDVLRVKPSRNQRYGRFTEQVKSPGPGTVSIVASHAHTAAQRAFKLTRKLSALSATASFGSTGPFVELIQQRLAALHLYLPQSGRYDSFTGLAVDAYHRLLGWGTSQTLTGATISYLLDGFGRFKVRFPRHGMHAEGDLRHQLLALIDGAKVQYLLPISSGKPSTPTILGDFHVYRRDPGYLPDGMYYADFFTGGYAIHGYDPAPDYPASHGCMRLPIQDAVFVYDWLHTGDWVDTYQR